MGRRNTHQFVAVLTTWLALSASLINVVYGDFNYKEALGKSILFLEAQRSGKLPKNNRVPWRGDSGLTDGKSAGVDLVGGYYDAGDNVKYGLPMAFTVTTLAWSTILYRKQLQAAGELKNALDGIRWGTDYFLKASKDRNKLWVHVGDAHADHLCWIRPENMQTPRTVLAIDKNRPGSEIAAETAAALAAASIVFRSADRKYAQVLLNRAKQLFQFASEHKASYDGECPFYCSYSGYNDELLWGATWMYAATRDRKYFKFITEEGVSYAVNEWGWDNKYVGAQMILTKMFFANGEKKFERFKPHAENYVCAALPQSPTHQLRMTPGGFIHLRDGANTQYSIGAAFLLGIYSDILSTHNKKIQCGNVQFGPSELASFAKQQMDYILGKNPMGRSYMVGFGKNPPLRAHHRGASVPKLPLNFHVDCGKSWEWLHSKGPNPHVLTGAIVGGPDLNDYFQDVREDSNKTEPCTYINTMAVGVLAKLAGTRAKSC